MLSALILLIAGVSAQVSAYPPLLYRIEWQADIYYRGGDVFKDILVDDYDEDRAFSTLHKCVSAAYKRTPELVTFISAFQNDADVSLRWRCKRAL